MAKSIPEIFESESNFCLIVWEYEPVTGGALVRLCAERLGWKKSTVYTVIKRLAARGVIATESGVITSLISKQAYALSQVKALTDKYFDSKFDTLVSAWKNPKESKVKRTDITTAKDISCGNPTHSGAKAAARKNTSPPAANSKTTVAETVSSEAEKPSETQNAVQRKKIPAFLL